ncbi:MAG: 50S ribosomal protein L35 [Candidatus Omnitrophica bacterium]|nr:50S ribosomal protein L35 [Candidatus Omnitrophota bacterium]
MAKINRKTKKAVRKRFRITGKGKVLKSHAFHRHLLTDRSSGRKRRLRGTGPLSAVEARRVKTCLPYG